LTSCESVYTTPPFPEVPRPGRRGRRDGLRKETVRGENRERVEEREDQ
jgi:hypothetical protein